MRKTAKSRQSRQQQHACAHQEERKHLAMHVQLATIISESKPGLAVRTADRNQPRGSATIASKSTPMQHLILRASSAKSGRYTRLPGLKTQPAGLLQRTASFEPLQGLTSTGHDANAYMHLWQATTGASQSGAPRSPCAEVSVSALLCFHQGHSPRALAGSLVPRDPPNACRGEQYVHNPPEVQAGAHHRAAPHI